MSPYLAQRLRLGFMMAMREEIRLCGAPVSHQVRWAIPTALAVLSLVGCGREQTDILSWSAYSEIDVQWPYVIRLDHHGGGALLYYGAAHTSDPSDPQIEQIESFWIDFNPDASFNEGGDPPTYKDRDKAVRKHGEPGLIRHLAARDHVPVRSLEPSRETEATVLIDQFGKLRVKMFYLLRAAAQYGMFERDRSLHAEMERVLRHYSRIPGLEGTPISVDDIRVTLDRLI